MSDSSDRAEEPLISYFVMKCINLDSLQQCIQSNVWACRKRDNPPHPIDLLSSAHERGRVFLIFSVNGQHGWQGYCESCFKKESEDMNPDDLSHQPLKSTGLEAVSENENAILTEPPTTHDEKEEKTWYHFPVKWLVHFQKFNAYSCVDFKYTDSLELSDGSPINKARNWQQLPCDVGQHLCSLLGEHHTNLGIRNTEEKLMRQPESFFKDEQNVSVAKQNDTWHAIIEKVSGELGKVHLVCPFGSQRYNCNVAQSDLDVFVLYQARTVDMLSLDPPKQTIKNSHHEEVDYSVLELQRYCELLVKGDAKCVETLFLSESPVVVEGSPAWHRLCTLRRWVLTDQCLDKYMKEIHGTTGLKQFQKWRDANPDAEELTPKLAKLGYIVLRLLQHARDIAKNQDMVVFREDMSLEREELMTVRKGAYTYSEFRAIVDRYLTEIEKHKSNIKLDAQAAKSKVQDWMLDCRIQDLQQDQKIKLCSADDS